MTSFIRYLTCFIVGVICGVYFMSLNQSDEPILSLAEEGPPPAEAVATHPSESQASVGEAVDSTPSGPDVAYFDELPTTPTIPDAYRKALGPVVRHKSFGERYEEFEAEPIDGAWAQAMEYGINDFIAVHGPSSNEVFDFIQCRSSSCVLAGYTDLGREPNGASIIGDLSRQSWWQGGGRASSTNSVDGSRRTFVIFIARYND